MYPIIDTHQHLWDLGKFDLPWVDGAPALKRNYLMADYLAATAEQNVAKAVYMEVDVIPAQRLDEVNYLISVCEDPNTPTAGAVVAGSPADPGFRAYIDEIRSSAYIKGIRQVLHVPEMPPAACLEDAFVKGVQYLGQVGLSFDLCMRPAELMDAVALVERCPDTQFILDHCGNADPNIVRDGAEAMDNDNPFGHTNSQWRDAISALGERANVVGKISGIVARTQPGWTAADLAPTINHCLDAFGPDRVIFGGDWPVCTLGATYEEWGSALREVIASRSETEQSKLLHDNAARLYGLGE